VIELTCAEVVPLIAQSGPQLDLVVSRRPADLALGDGPTDTADLPAATSKHSSANAAAADKPSAGHLLDRKQMKEDVI